LLHANSSSASDLERELDELLNRWGFTTVFDPASALDNTLALREERPHSSLGYQTPK
jgi:hypothetical protein